MSGSMVMTTNFTKEREMADLDYINKFEKIKNDLERTFLGCVERIQGTTGGFDGDMLMRAANLATVIPFLERMIEAEKEKG